LTYNHILITGGAGFVGSNLALWLKGRRPAARVVAVDNLMRRGSELNLPRLQANGVEFVHADVRFPGDLTRVGDGVDLLIECAAEPSVLAGYGQQTDFVVQTNLVGAVNCLDIAGRSRADVVFLSTSRVYPIAALNAIATEETDTRFLIAPGQVLPGVSPAGIAEEFPLVGARSLYGASKLCSELLIHEYAEMFGLRFVINRCSVLAGPWQMGKVDQGVFALWAARHLYGRDLCYIGWGGGGEAGARRAAH
jgi:CDP-paratose 2-epimerase